MNAANDGRGFQKLLDTVMNAYEVRGLATFRRTMPPARVIGHGLRAKVIWLPNPWLDYVGTWTARGGQSVIIEAKSTMVPRLSVQHDPEKQCDGIKLRQLQSAEMWQAAGAAVLFLWEFEGKVRFLTPAMVRAYTLARKSVTWLDAHRVPQGMGFILFDFLSCLASLTPCAASGTLATHDQTSATMCGLPEGSPRPCEENRSESGAGRTHHTAPEETGHPANGGPLVASVAG